MPHEPPSLTTALVQLSLILGLVLANGFFVASEFALVSVRKTRIDQLAAQGNASAVAVQRAVRRLNHYIGAVQVGVTLASLLLGAQGEKTLEPMLLPLFKWMPDAVLTIPRLTFTAGFAYLIMTTMHVVLGELVPKAITLQKSETVAMLLVRPMSLFAKLVWPLVWALTGLSGLLLRLMHIAPGNAHAQVHSSEELGLLIKESHEGGELNQTEAEILHRVVRFSDMTARKVMVPRVEMQGLPVEISRAELMSYIRAQPHTRTPIYHGTMDEIVGIVHLKDLVRFEADLPEPLQEPSQDGVAGAQDGVAGDALNLMPVVREAARVPETMTIDRLLLEFKRQRQQMAIVIDEFGGTSGIVTMGDLLDQVFGDVPDEFDAPEPEIFARADGRIQAAGRALIDDINDEYGVGFSTEYVDTLGGLVLDKLGRPAQVGDEVTVNGVHIRVEEVDVELRRIAQLSLLLPATENAGATESRSRS